MNRIDNIINDLEYREYMSRIEAAETTRRFCLHGFSHALDVARISYIINMEEKLGYDKAVIYAMALLHDIGRIEEYERHVSHHQAGAVISKDILVRCGFDAKQVDDICDAIASHKSYDSEEHNLKYLLFKADKLSRNCFDCKMYDECYWADELKNKTVIH